jgi:hypothetical protein
MDFNLNRNGLRHLLALRRAALVHPHACGYGAGLAGFPLLSLARVGAAEQPVKGCYTGDATPARAVRRRAIPPRQAASVLPG